MYRRNADDSSNVLGMELDQGEGKFSLYIFWKRERKSNNRITGDFYILFWAFLYFPSFP